MVVEPITISHTTTVSIIEWLCPLDGKLYYIFLNTLSHGYVVFLYSVFVSQLELLWILMLRLIMHEVFQLCISSVCNAISFSQPMEHVELLCSAVFTAGIAWGTYQMSPVSTLSSC